MSLRWLTKGFEPDSVADRRSEPEIESIWSVVNGRRIHSRAALLRAPDRAPEVVLVHGLVVASKYMEPLISCLARDYRVYAPDLPGYGRSDKPERALTVPELASALLGWMDSVGLDRPMLIGNSFGCQIVVELARICPGRVRATVLVGPTVDPQRRTLPSQAILWLRNALIEPPSLGLTLIRDFYKAGLVRTIHTLRVFINDEIEDKLPLVHVPTLVVRGARDPIVPDRWANRAVDLLPHGRLAVIPGTGHTANYAAPLEVARVARMFDDSSRTSPTHAQRPDNGGPVC